MCFGADSDYLPGFLIDSHDRWLVYDYPFAAKIDEGVSGTEIDADIVREILSKFLEILPHISTSRIALKLGKKKSPGPCEQPENGILFVHTRLVIPALLDLTFFLFPSQDSNSTAGIT